MPSYGYIHANISGIDRGMTPAGEFLPFPQEKIGLLMNAFRDGGADYKHGMSVERDQQGRLYYLCACASRQTNQTSAAGGYTLHAELRNLSSDEFLDDWLDRLLRFPFADEIDITCGRVPLKTGQRVEPVSAIRLDEKMLAAIIYGSLARLISHESPIYIALPVQGYGGTDFDETVRRLLKTIYSAMPYALRARSGYITYPNLASLPEGVTLCFIPDIMAGLYAHEPVLYPAAPNACRPAIGGIMHPDYGQGLRHLAEHLAGALPEERHKLFEIISASGIETEKGVWASFDFRRYGVMFALEHDFESLETDKQKREFISELAKQGDTALLDMAWNGVFKNYAEEHFQSWLAPAQNAKTLKEFAEQLEELKEMDVLEHLQNLRGVWNTALQEYQKKLYNMPNARDQLDEAYSLMLSLFDHDHVTKARDDIEGKYRDNAQAEYDNAIIDIQVIQEDDLYIWYSDALRYLHNLRYEENKPPLQTWLVDDETDGVKSKFKTMCESEDSRCEDTLKAFQEADAELGRALKRIWDEYLQSQTLEAYFEKVSRREKCSLNSKWSLDEYFNAWLIFYNARRRSMNTDPFIDVILEDFSELSSRSAIEFSDLVDRSKIIKYKQDEDNLWALYDAIALYRPWVNTSETRISFGVRKEIFMAEAVKAIQNKINGKSPSDGHKSFIAAVEAELGLEPLPKPVPKPTTKPAQKSKPIKTKSKHSKPKAKDQGSAMWVGPRAFKKRTVFVAIAIVVLVALSIIILLVVKGRNSGPEVTSAEITTTELQLETPSMPPPPTTDTTTVATTTSQSTSTTTTTTSTTTKSSTTYTTTTTTTTTTEKPPTPSADTPIVTPSELRMKVQDEKQINVKNPPKEGIYFEDFSINGVINLDTQTGRVTALKKGSALVGVLNISGKQIGTCFITVE